MSSSKRRNQSWEAASWQGSRRVQLRAALAMTLRQRFQALDDLSVLAQKLASMPRTSTPQRKTNRAAR